MKQQAKNIASRNVNITSRKITSRKINITSRKINITSRSINITSRNIQITSLPSPLEGEGLGVRGSILDPCFDERLNNLSSVSQLTARSFASRANNRVYPSPPAPLPQGERGASVNWERGARVNWERKASATGEKEASIKTIRGSSMSKEEVIA